MATARDVQDIFGLDKPASTGPGLGAPGTSSHPAKKGKRGGHGRASLSTAAAAGIDRRVTGLNREVLALHGDRPPPVVVVDVAKSYRAKPKKEFLVRKWWVILYPII